MTTILLVDDQQLVRTGFKTILETEPGLTVVGQAADGAEAITLTEQLDPDVICMDVQMPGMDGIAATERIVASGARAAVLILTTFDRDDFLFETLRVGASGFLLKTAAAEELIAAVQTLAGGDALLSPAVTRRVIQRSAGTGHTPPPREPIDPAREALGAGGLPVNLTGRETEILHLMARGLANAEIAAELVVGESTVKTHVSNVLMKLGVRDRIHAVIWAHQHRLGE